MNHRVAKAVFGAVASGVRVAGCATTVDWGGPLGHYRYNYDSRPVVSESTVTVPAPSTTYVAPTATTTYVAPAETTTTTYSAPVTTYRGPVTTYSVPSTTYRESRIVYPETTVTYYGSPRYTLYPTPSMPYTDHGQ